jgi:UDP:flavonoid glycosyltransferase YjiC (YdhE family)
VESAARAEWSAGVALPDDANTIQIQAAVKRVLSNASYRAEAQRRATALAGLNSAELAADSLETLIGLGTIPSGS